MILKFLQRRGKTIRHAWNSLSQQLIKSRGWYKREKVSKPFFARRPGKIDIELYLTFLFALVPRLKSLRKNRGRQLDLCENNYMAFPDGNPSLYFSLS